MNKVQAYWEALPRIIQAHILDYKFTDYKWENLNETDRALISIRKANEEKDDEE